MNNNPGKLFIVATPIGNLDDISERAKSVLSQVALILAEDTRHAGVLLSKFGISTKTRSFHEHNEDASFESILELLRDGTSIALISDAGTPLISDPGYRLVRHARINGIEISPVPGPSAIIAAISASGLPTDRFTFEGFLPAKSGQRCQRLEAMSNETRTLVFYESSHRIRATLDDMAKCFGGDTEVTIAREMTKKFESFYFGSFDAVIAQIDQDAMNLKGEFVIVVAVKSNDDAELDSAIRLLKLLVETMSVKQAAKIASKTFDVNKNRLYELALEFKQQDV